MHNHSIFTENIRKQTGVTAIKKLYFYILGAVTGAVNGIFGSGGGTVAVPMLDKAGFEPKSSHASSIAITLPLSIVSAVFYAAENAFDFKDALPLIPFGLGGAVLGSIFLKKVSNTWLKILFGAFLIFSGGRMLLT
ncbi:MAG: sulfite exporter TauE/SafE family protein [Oscillospiraceae bacterium]|nr:sulfite exporter TauE/SafE family protein [Oscillospiraceae bacterium]